MKTKFLLTLLALTGLCSIVTSASASTVSQPESDRHIADLSRTIAESIGLNPDTLSLIEFAIDRALIAQKLSNCKTPTSSTDADVPANDSSCTDKQKVTRGRIAKPTPQSSEQPTAGKVAVPTPPPKIRVLGGARG